MRERKIKREIKMYHCKKSFANGIGIFRRVFGSELEDEGEIGVGTE